LCPVSAWSIFTWGNQDRKKATLYMVVLQHTKTNTEKIRHLWQNE
jgi:hypothetical protein